jgi:AcrR family transcriptional regulator
VRKQRERAEREALIRRTARSVAEREGWDAVTTRRLAQEIDYSQPVLYSHFAGKREIVAAVALEGFGELAAALRATDDVVTAYVDFGLANPALYDAMFTLASDLPWGTEATPAPLRAAFEALRAAVGPDETRTEVAWAALHGLVTLTRAGRLRPDHDGARRQILKDTL